MSTDGKSRKTGRPAGAQPLSHLVAGLVDPLLLRRAGMASDLLSSWPAIAGIRLGEGCRPERLVWPPGKGNSRRPSGATLLVACDNAFVLRLQHESGDLLARVNGFFGYPAVARLRVVQKHEAPPRPSRKPALRPLDAGDHRTIAEATSNIENPRLKAALTKFGECVLGRNEKPRS